MERHKNDLLLPLAYIPPSTLKHSIVFLIIGREIICFPHFQNCFYFKTVKSSSIYTKFSMLSDKSLNKYSITTVTKMLWYHPNAIGDKQKEDTRRTECMYVKGVLLEMNAKYIISNETSLKIHIISKDILDSWEIGHLVCMNLKKCSWQNIYKGLINLYSMWF